MKKILLSSILILLSVQFYAFRPAILGDIGGGTGGGANECTGLLVCQNFETTAEACDPCTEDNSESWDKVLGTSGTATVDCATGTGNCPLRGSQSLQFNSQTSLSYATTTFSPQSEVWFFTTFQISADTNENIMGVSDGPTSRCVTDYGASTNKLYIGASGTTTTLSLNTTDQTAGWSLTIMSLFQRLPLEM